MMLMMAAAGSGTAIKEGDTGKGHGSPSESRLEVEEGSLPEGGGNEAVTCRAPKTEQELICSHLFEFCLECLK